MSKLQNHKSQTGYEIFPQVPTVRKVNSPFISSQFKWALVPHESFH